MKIIMSFFWKILSFAFIDITSYILLNFIVY